MNLMPLDIFFLVLILIAVIRCVIKGFISELFSFIAIAGGIILAFLFNDLLAAFINELSKPSRWNTIIAFLVIFIAVYLIIKIMEGILHKVLDKLNLEKLDKALGLFLGLIEGALVVIVLIYLMNFLPFERIHRFMDGSFISGFVNNLFDWSPGMTGQNFSNLI